MPGNGVGSISVLENPEEMMRLFCETHANVQSFLQKNCVMVIIIMGAKGHKTTVAKDCGDAYESTVAHILLKYYYIFKFVNGQYGCIHMALSHINLPFIETKTLLVHNA